MADAETDPDAPSTYKVYGSKKSKAAPQTVFPKAQGNEGAAPTAPVDPNAPSTYKVYGDKKPKAAPSDDSVSWYNVFHPKPADLSRPQTWTDWMTRTYEPSAKQVGTAALDDVSFGFADPIQAHFTGENVANIRARTADAQAAMGPGGPLVNALTYAVPGSVVGRGLETVGAGGRVAGVLGRYGASALEGGAANATSSVGHQIADPNHPIDPRKVITDTATGAVFGVGGQAAGDAAAAAARRISNYVRGSPGRGGETWNWRERAAAGDPTLPDDISLYQRTLAPADPAQPTLAKTQAALNQSVEPGRVADAVYGGAGAVGTYMGMPPDYQLLGAGFGGLTAGGVARSMLGSPGARGINTIDRNINVGQSLDQLYPALYGRQSTPALDTSGWADAVRQFAIGSERPGPPGSQFW